MLKNYFLIALRQLCQNPLYSAINILGLTIGIACCILILTAVRYEFSFDKYFSDSDRIYRVVSRFKNSDTGESMQIALTAFPAVKQLAIDFPEVESSVRLHGNVFSLKKGNNKFAEYVYLADPDVFRIFDFRFIAGNPETALKEPLSVVLTASMAEKYFGSQNPIGQTLSVENRHELKLTGVIEDTPPNTHFNLGVIISLASAGALLDSGTIWQLEDWNSTLGGNYGYIKLKPGASPENIINQLDAFFLRHAGNENSPTRPLLQALEDIHLNPTMAEPETERIGHRWFIHGAIILAGVILLTACINFINLTTARAGLRTREIGMRKVLGAVPRQLVIQLLMEALLLTLASTLLACVIVELLLPSLGNMVNRDFRVVYQWDALSVSVLFSLVLFTTLLAGGYPALVLSRRSITKSLNGEEGGQSGSRLRRLLSISQFALSLMLIITTIMANAQFRFISSMDLGFNRDRILLLSAMQRDSLGSRFVDDIDKNYKTLRTELLRHPGIVKVGGSNTARMWTGMTYFNRPGQPEGNRKLLTHSEVDHDFIDVYGMRLIAGRSFFRNRARDKISDNAGAAILTRHGVHKLGFTDAADAVGETVLWWGRKLRVVGVVDDVQAGGGYDDRKVDIFINYPRINALSLKLDGMQVAETLEYIDKTWNRIIPDHALNRYFYDTSFEKMDDIFQRVITGVTTFALLAILIACLGLYAMASFVAERRRKEVGIRKVLGASVQDIIKLLLIDLSKPVFIAILISIPASVLIVNRLLASFPEQVPLHVGYFLISISITLAIAWLTVAAHTWRVANLNPAISLRYE